jgi:hypothetical protein
VCGQGGVVLRTLGSADSAEVFRKAKPGSGAAILGALGAEYMLLY